VLSSPATPATLVKASFFGRARRLTLQYYDGFVSDLIFRGRGGAKLGVYMTGASCPELPDVTACRIGARRHVCGRKARAGLHIPAFPASEFANLLPTPLLLGKHVAFHMNRVRSSQKMAFLIVPLVLSYRLKHPCELPLHWKKGHWKYALTTTAEALLSRTRPPPQPLPPIPTRVSPTREIIDRASRLPQATWQWSFYSVAHHVSTLMDWASERKNTRACLRQNLKLRLWWRQLMLESLHWPLRSAFCQ
jgi:hypothetical protein